LVLRRLLLAPERLTEFPESGRVVPEIGLLHLRELIVSPFWILYRVRPGSVEIVTVFRSSRQFPADVG
jgi:plasmid stabilization system protein ParE